MSTRKSATGDRSSAIADRQVGHRKPRTSSQFAEGVSGNPSGRPRRSRGTVRSLADILKERIRVSNGQTRRKVSKYEAIANATVNSAIKGDLKLALQIVKFFPELQGEHRLRRSDKQVTPEEAAAAYRKFIEMEE